MPTHFLREDLKIMERRLSFGPTAEDRKNQTVILLIGRPFALMTIVLPGLDYHFQ
jgi:hypothetical protein